MFLWTKFHIFLLVWDWFIFSYMKAYSPFVSKWAAISPWTETDHSKRWKVKWVVLQSISLKYDCLPCLCNWHLSIHINVTVKGNMIMFFLYLLPDLTIVVKVMRGDCRWLFPCLSFYLNANNWTLCGIISIV